MTLLKIVQENYIDKRNMNRIRDIVYLLCDECLQEFICEKRYNSRVKVSILHFCSKECTNKSIKNGKLREQTVNTLNNKYGSSFVETEKFKKIREEIFLQKYGGLTPFASEEIRQKTQETFLRKYGSKSFAGTEEHKSKLDYIDIANKAWITKIANGTCSKSKPEEKIYLILTSIFDKDDIVRQYKIIKQWVDFYIKSIDTYIQVDGVYWHGLNRKTSEIKLQKTTQDKKIYKQILRDQKLDQYMKNNGFRILRFTDIEINNLSDEEIINRIKEI